jgi:hypothetical protein
MPADISVHLAVEDPLSDAVLRSILIQSGQNFIVGSCYQHGGFGYLKNKISGFNQAAKGIPFFVLTDLDQQYPCPSALIADWLRAPKQPNLLFRVAVREIESWVLADREAFSSFLGIRRELIPRNTDQLPDPKHFLLDMIRKSRKRNLRLAILPSIGSTAKQGPDYNGPLVEFVETKWNVKRAVANSPSLKRTLDAVHRFKPMVFKC